MALVAKLVTKAKQWHLLVLCFCWFLVYYYNQRYLPRKYADSCSWSNWNELQHVKQSRFVLFVADPQLVDNHTYPSYNPFFLSMTKHTSDQYIKRNFKYLSKVLSPDSIIFLGDYQDNGRSSSDKYYADEMVRFKKIFKNYNNLDPLHFVTSLPGNHDIGWKNGITEHALERFEQSFGDPVPFEQFDTLFVPINSLALSNTNNEKIYSKPRKVLDDLNQKPKDKPRVLLTHVPLMRPKEAKCGKLRESSEFPFVAGHQYQTVLDDLVSQEILQKVKPDLVFSGDDHDYCSVEHKYKDGDGSEQTVEEITVKSVSMTMGIHKPAVQLLAILDDNDPGAAFDKNKVKFNTTICYLPTPFSDIISYVVMAIISGLAIIFSTYIAFNKLRRYYNYTRMSNNNTKENFLIKFLKSARPPRPESPYAGANSPMESFSIDVSEDRDGDDYFPINNYRRMTRTRTSGLHYNPRSTFKNMLVKIVSMIFVEFFIVGTFAIALYLLFINLT